jgi:hypothetical protein
MCKITVFKTIESDSQALYFEIEDVFDRIKRGNNRHLIEQIRKEDNKTKRDFLKKRLLWICFSGQFSRRNNESIIEHSGYICLDFDQIPDKEIGIWRKKLQANPHTVACFTSPSGNGLKAIWRVPVCRTNEEHNRRFESIATQFADCRYFDHNVKGWSRVCFESYDPMIFTRKDAIVYEGIAQSVQIKTPTVQVKSSDVDVQVTFDKLIKWFESKYNLRKGNRNQGAFTFASGVAEYLRQDQAEPMLTSYIMQNVERTDSDPFTWDECQACIKQAYRNTPAPQKMMSSDRDHFDVPNVSGRFADTDELTLEEEEADITEFWIQTKTGLKADYLSLKLFLQQHGFYKYRFNPDDISFIRMQGQIVSLVTVDNIRDFVLEHLLNNKQAAAYNLFAAESKFDKKYIAFLEIREPKFIRDTKLISWYFYLNTAVRVSASKGVELVDYGDIDGYIWERQKIQRKFTKNETEGDFSKFLMNISAGNKLRCKSLLSGIGYMTHRYKDPSTSRAMIANEESKTASPAGGTGKGLIFQALSQVRVVVFVNGKSVDMTKDTVWQRVDPDTDIVTIDDPPKSFRFEDLFSILTTGWPIRKLYKGEIYLKPEDSPKIGITSNNVMKGNSSSHERRKFEVEIYPHYSDKHQPIDDFGRTFWSDWDVEEYSRFDNLMISCTLLYLREGLVFVDYVNLKVRKIMADTSDEFVEFAEEHFRNDERYHRNDWYKKFQEENPGSYCKSSNQFYEWMREFAAYKGWQSKDCGAGRMFIQFGEIDETEPRFDNRVEVLPF